VSAAEAPGRAAQRPAEGRSSAAAPIRPDTGPDGAAAAPVSDAEVQGLFTGLTGEPALVLAVSGGPDSTALLWLAARWAKRLKRSPELLACTIDHGLRAEARREAAAVKRLARSLGVPHRTLRWTGAKPATGVQAKARAERYRLLGQAARRIGARCILTAHTLDDQAETVLIRMARGSGMTGLAAMARVTPMGAFFIVRPLLDVAKARLVATLRAASVAFADDPSNRDPRFTRARLRALMPALAHEGLEARRLAQLARRLRRADAALEAITDAALVRLMLASPAAAPRRRRRDGAGEGAFPGRISPGPAPGPVDFDREGFAVLPEEVALRVLSRAITQVGDEGPVELKKLEVFAADLRAVLHADPGARAGRARFRRTLAGALVTLSDRLRVERAPARRRRPSGAAGRPQRRK